MGLPGLGWCELEAADMICSIEPPTCELDAELEAADTICNPEPPACEPDAELEAADMICNAEPPTCELDAGAGISGGNELEDELEELEEPESLLLSTTGSSSGSNCHSSCHIAFAKASISMDTQREFMGN